MRSLFYIYWVCFSFFNFYTHSLSKPWNMNKESPHHIMSPHSPILSCHFHKVSPSTKIPSAGSAEKSSKSKKSTSSSNTGSSRKLTCTLGRNTNSCGSAYTSKLTFTPPAKVVCLPNTAPSTAKQRTSKILPTVALLNQKLARASLGVSPKETTLVSHPNRMTFVSRVRRELLKKVPEPHP